MATALATIACLLAGCSAPSTVQQSSNGHWSFTTEIKLASKLVVNGPDKTPVLSFEFPKMGHSLLSMFPPITIRNMTARRLSLNYKVLGYDGQQRRVSEGDDSVVIEASESVLRQPILIPDAVSSPTAKTFRLLADIQH